MTPRTLTLLDFGTCAVADPASDIGKFLADLDWWYARTSRPGVKAAQAAFLAGYGANGSDHRLARARVFEILILVKSTVHRVALFDPDWAARTRGLIRYADRLLGAAEAGVRE